MGIFLNGGVLFAYVGAFRTRREIVVPGFAVWIIFLACQYWLLDSENIPRSTRSQFQICGSSRL